MSFTWPLVLVTLLILPLLIAGYVWSGRRRRRRAVAYSSVALIKAARPKRATWRRHLPFALLLTALACLALAGARPQIKADVPTAGASVILALDVSGSMCATDVEPNRLAAAQAAVRDFIRVQGSGTRIGVVAFSGFAELTVAPTTDRDELLRAVDSLTTGQGTTIGAAILKSVDAIAQIDPNVAPADAATPTPAPAPGSYAPEIIVLLTDGANTRGVSPAEAAKVAAQRGVRVYPIGFGTSNPTRMVCTAEQLGGNSFENFGRGGGVPGGPNGGSFLRADEPTLRQVANTTGGTFFSAKGSDQLQNVLGDLPLHVQIQQRNIEVSVALAGLAAILILLTIGAAVRWSTFPS
ncbi:MAG TPA: VWA domain-containing protein [Kineosporiaceae bacterium]|nr:VWA domain-containing protein [Kineosporiaceae bacterium]